MSSCVPKLFSPSMPTARTSASRISPTVGELLALADMMWPWNTVIRCLLHMVTASNGGGFQQEPNDQSLYVMAHTMRLGQQLLPKTHYHDLCFGASWGSLEEMSRWSVASFCYWIVRRVGGVWWWWWWCVLDPEESFLGESVIPRHGQSWWASHPFQAPTVLERVFNYWYEAVQQSFEGFSFSTFAVDIPNAIDAFVLSSLSFKQVRAFWSLSTPHKLILDWTSVIVWKADVHICFSLIPYSGLFSRKEDQSRMFSSLRNASHIQTSNKYLFTM